MVDVIILITVLTAVFSIGCVVGAMIDRHDQHKRECENLEYGDVPHILKDQAD